MKPHKDHTCILFEDGKCIYCGKIPEYPILGPTYKDLDRAYEELLEWDKNKEKLCT